MSKLDDYGVKEYPEQMNWLDEILNRQSDEPAALIRARLGEEQYRIFMEMSRIKEMTQSVHARLPFEIIYR